jgi:hypothetical protein
MAAGWFNANPHRIDLIQVGLRRATNTSAPLVAADLLLQEGSGVAGAAQELDPWTGEIRSNFTLLLGSGGSTGNSTSGGGVQYSTRTACHMDLDLISWRVERIGSPTHPQQQPMQQQINNEPQEKKQQHHATVEAPLVLRIAFPYADDGTPTASPSTHSHGGGNGQGANWLADEKHTTAMLLGADGQSVHFSRTLDHDAYEVVCRWQQGESGTGTMLKLVREGPHSFVLQPTHTNSDDGGSASAAAHGGPTLMEMSCLLAPPRALYPVGASGDWLTAKAKLTLPLLNEKGATLPLFDDVAANAAARWAEFWGCGAAIDLAGQLSPETESEEYSRAFELERRAVLSQYLTRSQSAGSQPPQETGYTLNSWMGRFREYRLRARSD